MMQCNHPADAAFLQVAHQLQIAVQRGGIEMPLFRFNPCPFHGKAVDLRTAFRRQPGIAPETFPAAAGFCGNFRIPYPVSQFFIPAL